MNLSKNKTLITLCSCAVVLCILGALVCSVVLGLRSECSVEAASSDEWVARSDLNTKKVLLSLNEEAAGDSFDFLGYYNTRKSLTYDNDPILPLLNSAAYSWNTPFYESSSYTDYLQVLGFVYGKYYLSSFMSTFNTAGEDASAVDVCMLLAVRVRYLASGAMSFYHIGFYNPLSCTLFFDIVNSQIATRYSNNTDYRVYNRNVLIAPSGDYSDFKGIASDNISGYYGIPFNFFLSSSGRSVNTCTFIPKGYVLDLDNVPSSYKESISDTSRFNAMSNTSVVSEIRSVLSNYYAVASQTFIANTSDTFYTDGFNAGYDRGYDMAKKDITEAFTDYYKPILEETYQNGYNAGVSASEDSISSDLQTKYDDGFVAGKTAGYSVGYTDGAANSQNYTFMGLLGAVIDAPITAFTGLLDFEVLGVNMSSFVLSMLTLSVIVIIIKICLGGK